MVKNKKPVIAVFCGSKSGKKDIYTKKTQEISSILTKSSYQIIYGGGRTGLMGNLSKVVKKEKGNITGVIPSFLNNPKLVQTDLSYLHDVKSLSIRKKLMIDKSDIIIILPGGFGTLDELFEILTMKQLGLSNKRIIIYNISGFWKYLQKLILFLKEEGFIKKSDLKEIYWAKNSKQVINFVENYNK